MNTHGRGTNVKETPLSFYKNDFLSLFRIVVGPSRSPAAQRARSQEAMISRQPHKGRLFHIPSDSAAWAFKKQN
ncbi:MAG: hypothetical protein ACK4UV_12250, partial [Ignavibacterium sp.]